MTWVPVQNLCSVCWYCIPVFFFWFHFNLFVCSEFIGEDGNDRFWQFVDTVKELTVYKNGGTLDW